MLDFETVCKGRPSCYRFPAPWPSAGDSFLWPVGVIGNGQDDERRQDNWPEEMKEAAISDRLLCGGGID